METVTTAVTNALSIATSCIDFVTNNAILAVCFGACVVPVGFKIFKAARKSVGAR